MGALLKIVETPETMALAEFDVTEAALAEIKQYEALEIQDSKSEGHVRKCRQVVRTMRTDVDRRRKELKAPLLAHGKLIDQTAKELTARLLPTETCLDEKIKAVEAIAETARAEKMAAEKIRTDAILEKITYLENVTSQAQAYGMESGAIKVLLGNLTEYKITEEVFQEFTENTLRAHEKNIEIVTAALERTIKWEADQKAQAQIEAANKAEAQRLAEIAKAQEEAAAKVEAEAKAERDAESAKIAAERKAFEDEKAKAAAEIQAERDRIAQAEAEKAEKEKASLQYSQDWDKAHEFNNLIAWGESRAEALNVPWLEEAYWINEEMDLNREVAEKEALTRAEALRPDREKLIAFAEMIAAIQLPELNTAEGNQIAQVADVWLRGCVTEIMAGVQESNKRSKK